MFSSIVKGDPVFYCYLRSCLKQKGDLDDLACFRQNFAPLAQLWVSVSKFFAAAKAFTATGIGSFETLHSTLCADCQKEMNKTRTFISVVSTVKVILETLPQQSKAQQSATLTSHIDRVKGHELPTNLMEYLQREQKKLK